MVDFSSLARVIEDSVREDVEGKRVVVAFSGGIDSTTLAFLSKKYAKKVFLLTVYAEGKASQDKEFSLILSEQLSLPLYLSPLSKSEVKELMNEIVERLPHVRDNFVKVDVLVPVLKVLKEAEELKPDLLLFGSGSEEVFVGYDRYYRWLREKSEEEVDYLLREEYREMFRKGDIYSISKLSEGFSYTLSFPFAKEAVARVAFSFPLSVRVKDKERKKYILRKAASLLGVPALAIERKKKAMQYGSSVHKFVEKLWRGGK